MRRSQRARRRPATTPRRLQATFPGGLSAAGGWHPLSAQKCMLLFPRSDRHHGWCHRHAIPRGSPTTVVLLPRPACLPTHLPARLPTCRLPAQPSCPPTCPPACLPTFLPAATTPAGPTPAPSWPAWASTSPRLLASTLCRPARPAEMPPRCVPSQHRPLHGPCVLLDLVLVGHICLPSPGESMRLARTLRAPGRGHHDSLPCRACHALGRPAQTQPSPALPVGRSLQPR